MITEQQGESILEVAKFFLKKHTMTHKKLQKLCYFSQAWFLACKGRALMPDARFEAWVHGPASPILYREYGIWKGLDICPPDTRYRFKNKETEEFLKKIWKLYGNLSGEELEEISKKEPWKNARAGYRDSELIRIPIPSGDMKKYYRSLLT